MGLPIYLYAAHVRQHIEPNKAVGQQIGFYLGEPKDRTVAFTIEFSGRLNVYDANTREYLRIATREDVKKWNDAIEARVTMAGELEENWPRNDYESDWRQRESVVDGRHSEIWGQQSLSDICIPIPLTLTSV